jgi:hypothetical protein
MKKGGGTGPLKPWQPIQNTEQGAKSNSAELEKISSPRYSSLFFYRI